MLASPWKLLILMVAAAAISGGCSASRSDKAGGERAVRPVVLTMANGQLADWDEGQASAFANEVTRLSHGAIQIEVVDHWHASVGLPAVESAVIKDVAAGKADLGWVGSREWASHGAKVFSALQAPFLIDSYDLEERVVRSGLLEEALRNHEPARLVGLGVLPGSIRRPLSVTRPLVSPSDYGGLTIGVDQSQEADETMQALGATTVTAHIGLGMQGLDGLDLSITAVETYGYDANAPRQGDYYAAAVATARYVTANVSLWPSPIVLFANRKAFADLSPDQQSVLRRAIANVIPDEMSRVRSDERNAAGTLCRRGLTFETASARDLAALRKSVRPVYALLERDPQTRAFIEQIVRMRRPAASRADGLSCPRPSSGPREPVGRRSPIDGVWRMDTTFGDWPDPHPIAEKYGTWTYVFSRGRFAITQEYKNACTWGYGKFNMRGHEMAWTFTNGGGQTPNYTTNNRDQFFRFGWSLYRDTLIVTPVKSAVSPENFRAKPWHLISTTPSRRYFSKHCSPPTDALTR